MRGLFLYREFFFFLMESASLWFALAIMEEISLWQRKGVFSSCGGVSSGSTSVTKAGSVLVSAEVVMWGLFGVGVSLLWLLAEFCNRVMRLICLLSDLLIGVWILLGWVCSWMCEIGLRKAAIVLECVYCKFGCFVDVFG